MTTTQLLRAGLMLLPLSAALPAHALECPVSPNAASKHEIVANAPQIKQFQKRLAAENPAAAAESIIGTLKVMYPKASDEGVANFMIALECPVIAEQNKGDAWEKTQVKQFADTVHSVLAESSHS